MFRKILFPTDFSDAATDAMEIIKQLKDSGVEEVVVLHVIRDKYFYLLDEYSQIDLEDMAQESIREASIKLAAIASDLQKEGFKVKTRLARGVPLSEILEAEKQEDVSLIVLGSHQKSLIKLLLQGSVSGAVIRKSERPVLLVAQDRYKGTKRETEKSRILKENLMNRKAVEITA